MRRRERKKSVSIWMENQQNTKIDMRLVQKVGKIVLEGLGLEFSDKEVQINIIFVDDMHIRQLNKRYRNADIPTDVLAFPMGEKSPESGEHILGDIAISVETAKRHAEKYGHGLQEELSLLLIHGILHLAGYDHEKNDDVRKMNMLQQHYMEKAKYLLSNLDRCDGDRF